MQQETALVFAAGYMLCAQPTALLHAHGQAVISISHGEKKESTEVQYRGLIHEKPCNDDDDDDGEKKGLLNEKKPTLM